jgi:amino acid permease
VGFSNLLLGGWLAFVILILLGWFPHLNPTNMENEIWASCLLVVGIVFLCFTGSEG